MIKRLITISIAFYCSVNLLSAQAYSPDPCYCYRGGGLSFSEGQFLTYAKGTIGIPYLANFLLQENRHRPTDLALHSLNGPVQSVITLECQAADSLGQVVRKDRYCDSVSNYYDERGYCTLWWGASPSAPTDGDRTVYLADWDDFGRPLFVAEVGSFWDGDKFKDTIVLKQTLLYDVQGRLQEINTDYNTEALIDSRRFRIIGPDTKDIFIYDDNLVKEYFVSQSWDYQADSMLPADTILQVTRQFVNGRVVSVNWYSEDGYLFSKTIYNYDADNYRSESSLYGQLGKWEKYEQQSIYNKEGKLVAEGHDTLGCADQFINDINDNVRYEFDEYNNWVKRIVYNEYGIPLRLHEREIEYYE